MDDLIHARLNNIERAKDLKLSLDHHHFLVLRPLYQWMREVAAPNAHGVLLDYGCGGCPYEKLFAPHIIKYIAADVATASDTKIDIMLTPNQPVPLGDASVDTILANQTLEHVSDPVFYLSECHRLLRPGGLLVLSAPMQWRHHESPYDYHRFTRFGIEHHLRIHNFVIKDLRPCGGTFALMGQIWLNYLFRERNRPRWIVRLINRFFSHLDRRYPDGDETINWVCLAQKPTRGPHS